MQVLSEESITPVVLCWDDTVYSEVFRIFFPLYKINQPKRITPTVISMLSLKASERNRWIKRVLKKLLSFGCGVFPEEAAEIHAQKFPQMNLKMLLTN